MGRDGEWIRDEADEDDWEEDDWPDDELLDDQLLDDEWLDDDPLDDEFLHYELLHDPSAELEWPMGSSGPEWPMGPGEPIGPGGPAGYGPAGYGKRWGHGGAPGFSGWIALAVAVVAAAAGVTAGFFLIRGAQVASATAGATPSASAPASSGSGAGLPQPGLPGNASGNGNGQVRMLLTGRVLAVSATSITIGGAGPSVTAAVTSATKITGSAHAIGGVKVGDEVAVEITGTSSHLVTITLQDPAQ